MTTYFLSAEWKALVEKAHQFIAKVPASVIQAKLDMAIASLVAGGVIEIAGFEAV